MAKPTDETLALPDFDVAIVQQINGNLTKDHINLKKYQASLAKGLILYFYPKDNTSGCTTQATDFTERLNAFADLGYAIIGVSRDSIDSHQNFIGKHDLAIALISDPEERLCQYYDVIKEKNMYGKKTLGLVRSTFVYNKQGELTHAQRNLRAKGYADRLLDSLPSA